ncbi:hypothetical protein ACRALDRAFT_208470 [Sodiomyces alcalophilus JCM 7366]|uniref:uncharacterized protein n=1 Tax=Sodiomyces alcalophilus JCM 7366 TaxID=591952 RepID=UPI0039B5E5FB
MFCNHTPTAQVKSTLLQESHPYFGSPRRQKHSIMITHVAHTFFLSFRTRAIEEGKPGKTCIGIEHEKYMISWQLNKQKQTVYACKIVPRLPFRKFFFSVFALYVVGISRQRGSDSSESQEMKDARPSDDTHPLYFCRSFPDLVLDPTAGSPKTRLARSTHCITGRRKRLDSFFFCALLALFDHLPPEKASFSFVSAVHSHIPAPQCLSFAITTGQEVVKSTSTLESPPPGNALLAKVTISRPQLASLPRIQMRANWLNPAANGQQPCLASSRCGP